MKKNITKERKSFKAALRTELREHKSSFIVFSVLRILIIATMVRQLFLHNYESFFFCIMTMLLLYVPSWAQVKLKIELPPPLEITILCFIFAAEILGEVNSFYILIPFWDTILHTLNGFLAAAVGFSTVVLLNNDKNLTFNLSPIYMALTAFCFSMTIGVLWEFFEFSMDMFFGTDMQKDTIVNVINSVALDETKTNTVVTINNIKDVIVNNQSLGLGGYLDIGLIDTMKDLFVNFIGAVVFSITGYIYVKTSGKKKTIAQDFVPSKKTDETDYLAIEEKLFDEKDKKDKEDKENKENKKSK